MTRPIAAILVELDVRDLRHDFTKIAHLHTILLEEMFREYPGRPPAAVSDARHDCWAMLDDAGWSSKRIGRLFGVDHSSVLSGLKSREKRLARTMQAEIRRAGAA